jgi:hypothetical protein
MFGMRGVVERYDGDHRLRQSRARAEAKQRYLMHEAAMQDSRVRDA